MRCTVHRDQYIYQWSQEFKLLDEYLTYIEGSIDITLQDITAKLQDKEEYIECDDNQTAYFFDGLVLPDSAQMIFSRFLYNNYFLSLWATYETGLKEIAMFLSLANSLDDFEKYETNKKKNKKRTKDFVKEIFEYFNEIHKIDIPTKTPINQKYLINLYILRNIVAHGNGRTNDISNKNKKIEELLKWAKKQSEISVSEDGWILLNGKFCRNLYEGLSSSFEMLCRLAYKAAPNNEPRPVKAFYVHY